MPVDPAPAGPAPAGPAPAGPAPAGPVLGEAQLARLAGSRFSQVVQLTETTSTNSVLVGRADDGASEGMVLVADYQTAGRGRFERRWESPPGKSLLFSVLLWPNAADLPPARRHLAVAAVSLALVEAASHVTNVAVQLKWPNDLVFGGKKVAGVLAEATARGAVVVGAGVNVAWAPEPLERPGAQAATCLDTLAGRHVPRDEVLVGALLALDRLYGDWDLVSRLYRRECSTVGHEVMVSFAGHQRELVGTATAVDEDGRLVVRDAQGRTVTVAAGDVTHASGR